MILIMAGLNYDSKFDSFIVLATYWILNYDHTVITIVIYDHKTFIAQAIGSAATLSIL
jgi:hypothetical protein